jgi:hypothetical protein
MSQPHKSSAKARAGVNKTKGAVTKAAPPPSEESNIMKAKKKTGVGKTLKRDGIIHLVQPRARQQKVGRQRH